MRQLRTMPVSPVARRRLQTQQAPVGVDRVAQVIKGYVVAQEGPFKSEGRGEFDLASLQAIIKLWPAAGLKSRFGHPTESSDSLGRFIGRAHNPRLSKTSTGISCVRADLKLDRSCFVSPEGNLGRYLLSLASSDSEAFSSSLVLSRDEEYRLEKGGARMVGADGEPLPPLWRPKRLYATDVVDEGDAVDGFLGGRYPGGMLARGARLLDGLAPGRVEQVAGVWLKAFLDGRQADLPSEVRELLQAMLGGQARVTVENRAHSWLARYLNQREQRTQSKGCRNPRILRLLMEAKQARHDAEIARIRRNGGR